MSFCVIILFLGVYIFSMDSNLCFTGIIPLWLTHNPINFILVRPKKDFSISHFSSLSYSLFSESSILSNRYLQASVTNIIRSNIQAIDNPKSRTFLLLLPWKVSRYLPTQIVSGLNQYPPQIIIMVPVVDCPELFWYFYPYKNKIFLCTCNPCSFLCT